jgi:hypothetical protein
VVFEKTFTILRPSTGKSSYYFYNGFPYCYCYTPLGSPDTRAGATCRNNMVRMCLSTFPFSKHPRLKIGQYQLQTLQELRYVRTIATMSNTELKKRRRDDYPYLLDYRTRWYVRTCILCKMTDTGFRSDNDMYDHMNNSIYNFLSVSFYASFILQQLIVTKL